MFSSHTNTYKSTPIVNNHFVVLATQRGSDELLSQAAVMAPATDNNNQDLVSKKAKLDASNAAATVLGGVGKLYSIRNYILNYKCVNYLKRLHAKTRNMCVHCVLLHWSDNSSKWTRTIRRRRLMFACLTNANMILLQWLGCDSSCI